LVLPESKCTTEGWAAEAENEMMSAASGKNILYMLRSWWCFMQILQMNNLCATAQAPTSMTGHL